MRRFPVGPLSVGEKAGLGFGHPWLFTQGGGGLEVGGKHGAASLLHQHGTCRAVIPKFLSRLLFFSAQEGRQSLLQAGTSL